MANNLLLAEADYKPAFIDEKIIALTVFLSLYKMCGVATTINIRLIYFNINVQVQWGVNISEVCGVRMVKIWNVERYLEVTPEQRRSAVSVIGFWKEYKAQ